MGLGLGVLYDNIHNAMNPRKGLQRMGPFELQFHPRSDSAFTSYIVDNRIYHPIKENTVLAAQLYGQFTSGNPPFNMLALWAEKA